MAGAVQEITGHHAHLIQQQDLQLAEAFLNLWISLGSLPVLQLCASCPTICFEFIYLTHPEQQMLLGHLGTNLGILLVFDAFLEDLQNAPTCPHQSWSFSALAQPRKECTVLPRMRIPATPVAAQTPTASLPRCWQRSRTISCNRKLLPVPGNPERHRNWLMFSVSFIGPSHFLATKKDVSACFTPREKGNDW